MNEILQKRIEEAAKKIYCTDCPMKIIRNCKGCVARENAIETGIFALQNQWISVEEALPKEDEQVIAMSEFGDIERMKCHNKSFYHIKGSIIKDGEKITHWMENPSLEGGEK